MAFPRDLTSRRLLGPLQRHFWAPSGASISKEVPTLLRSLPYYFNYRYVTCTVSLTGRLIDRQLSRGWVMGDSSTGVLSRMVRQSLYLYEGDVSLHHSIDTNAVIQSGWNVAQQLISVAIGLVIGCSVAVATVYPLGESDRNSHPWTAMC